MRTITPARTMAPRRRSRGRWVPIAWLALVVVVAVGGFLVVRAFLTPTVTAGAVTVPNLPWPSQGQAAAEIEGVGSLGSSGDSTPVPIASVTKVMTAYVVLHDHPLQASEDGPAITVDEQAQQESGSSDESTVRVRAGQRYSEREMLELMLIPSGNNIARLLARWDAGSQDAFVQRMNATAAGFGMRGTTYTGASGVEDSTVSTATDQLVLARAALDDPVIASIVATRSVHIPGVPGPIVNTNTLLGHDGVIGMKTGSTSAAGGALMWAARSDAASGSRLIVGVVLYQNPGGSPDAGLAAALEASRNLVVGIENALPAIDHHPR
jgi:D-alanyl-D-alanine carboxypeptidase (penicillin-binding protein 5/6)